MKIDYDQCTDEFSEVLFAGDDKKQLVVVTWIAQGKVFYDVKTKEKVDTFSDFKKAVTEFNKL